MPDPYICLLAKAVFVATVMLYAYSNQRVQSCSRINLLAMIVSPVVAGQVMTSLDVMAGCLLMCAWNLCSFFVEWGLLMAVLKQCPELQNKGSLQAQAKQPKLLTE